MSSETLSRRALGRATLARQMLLSRAEVSVAEAVERLAGMQAQEPKHPFVGLWTRVEGFARGDLVKALERREVVRATLMRATLHLMSARDYAAVRPALQPALTAAMRGALRGRDDGLDLDALMPVARRLLEAEARDFNELRALLAEEFPGVNERALGYAARTNLPLVMVPSGESRWAFPQAAKFAPADGWIGAEMPRDAGPEPLVRRYLAAFGPATAADFQTWSGLKGAKGVFAGMRDELAVVSVDGRELFDLPEAPRPGEDVPAPPRFLPEFDNLVLAHADRTRLLPDEHRGKVVTKNLRVKATFLWDGEVAGTWTVARKRGVATLSLEPFAKLPRGAAKELKSEGEALLRFVEDGAKDFAVEVV